MEKKCANFILGNGKIDDDDEIEMVDELENMGIETDLDMNVKELCTLYMKEKYKRDKVKEDLDFPLYLKIKANPNIVLFKNSPIENKDTALKIMEHLDDKTLFNMCLGNKNLAKICNDENFWMRRTLKKFNFERADTNVSWKKIYLSLVYYTNKYFSNFALEMATKENFTDLALYIMGKIENIKNAESCLLAASKNGNEKLIDIFLKYMPRDYDFSYAIKKAAQGKHKNIIKKFVKLNRKNWSNIWSKGFEGACKSGDINMVLFFIKKGVLNDVAKKSLYFAGKYNHLNLIEFLINYDPKYVDYNEAFLGAVRGGHNLLMEKFIGKISDDLKNNDGLKI